MRPQATSRILYVLAIVVWAALVTSRVAADPRTDYLVRVLQTSEEFRVRAQAALSLGRLPPSPDITQALVRALADENAAVRSAAATSLETVGDGTALAALRTAQSDRDAAVRTAAQRAYRAVESRNRPTPATAAVATVVPPVNAGDTRYYVGVGTPGSRAAGLDASRLRDARAIVVRELGAMAGVEVAPENESSSQATGVLRRRSLAGFFIDSSITTLESGPQGTRAVISVIVGTYPGRDMRAMLQGSATVPGATGAEAEQMALEGAIRGALRRLPQAMASASPTASR